MCIYIYTLYIIQFMPNGGTLQKIMGDGSGHSTLKAGALRSTWGSCACIGAKMWAPDWQRLVPVSLAFCEQQNRPSSYLR